mgnify:CR=1 FL=1
MFLLIASVLCQVEPVGRWFEAFIKRRNINVSASFQELEDEKELSEESGDEELQLEEFPMLKTLDPKDWKVFCWQRQCCCVVLCCFVLFCFVGDLLTNLPAIPSC